MALAKILPRVCGIGIAILAAVSAAASQPAPSANPTGEKLVLTWADEFDGAALDDKAWGSMAYAEGLKRETARGPDNLEVRNGELLLHVRKEARPAGKRVSTWTAGYVFTRETVEPNSFIEARFKAGAASGVNNAFWLACVTDAGNDGVRNRYEIDIVETRRDDTHGGTVGRAHLAWHDWKTQTYIRNAKGARDHIAQGAHVEHTWDDYHVWGLWLGERETIYYLDGREVWRGETHPRLRDQWRTGVGKFPHWFPDREKEAYGRFGQDDWNYFGGFAGDRMNIVLSNLPWPEKWTALTDAAHGTFMAVDYVRVYRPQRVVERVPAEAQLAAAQTLRAGDRAVVTWTRPVALGAAGEAPHYFSFVTTGDDAALRVKFVDERGDTVFSVGRERDALLGGANIARTNVRKPAPPTASRAVERRWVIRYTPPLSKGARATVSLCVFPAKGVPEREPFFHANVDARGNTSANNEWHLNGRVPAGARAVAQVRFENGAAAAFAVHALQNGAGFRAVTSEVAAGSH